MLNKNKVFTLNIMPLNSFLDPRKRKKIFTNVIQSDTGKLKENRHFGVKSTEHMRYYFFLALFNLEQNMYMK